MSDIYAYDGGQVKGLKVPTQDCHEPNWDSNKVPFCPTAHGIK